MHDLESKRPLEVLQHQRAVCSLSIDPFNERVVTTAGNDGRLLLFDTRQSVHGKFLIYVFVICGLYLLLILSCLKRGIISLFYKEMFGSNKYIYGLFL